MYKVLRATFLKNYRRNCTVLTAETKSKLPPINPMTLLCTELQSGIKLVTAKEQTNLSRVIISLNAGSRFEKSSQLGITHVIRHALLGSNTYNTHISNTRCLFQIGSDVSVDCTRDNIIIKAAFGSRYLFNVLDFLGTALSHHKFYHWEIMYALQSCLIEYDNLKANLIVENVLGELHKTLFRFNYGNSLFVAPDCQSTIREYDVAQYFQENISGTRCAVGVYSNMSHAIIEEYVNDIFELPFTPQPLKPAVKTYSGEIIIPNGNRCNHTAFGYPAPSENEPLWGVYKVLQNYLGMHHEMPTTSLSHSRLASLLNNIYPSIKVSAFYMPYNHTGLFGFYVVADNKDYIKHMETMCTALKTAYNEAVNEDLLHRSIFQAKLDYTSKCWNITDYLTDASVSLTSHGEMPKWSENLAKIDSVTSKNIKEALMILANTRPVLVSSGDPSSIPPADDIVRWLKK